jgi:hypothetical protein
MIVHGLSPPYREAYLAFTRRTGAAPGSGRYRLIPPRLSILTPNPQPGLVQIQALYTRPAPCGP